MFCHIIRTIFSLAKQDFRICLCNDYVLFPRLYIECMINCFIQRTDLVPAYVRLLRDNEAEVRIASAGRVTKFCRILSPDIAIQHILPCVKVKC